MKKSASFVVSFIIVLAVGLFSFSSIGSSQAGAPEDAAQLGSQSVTEQALTYFKYFPYMAKYWWSSTEIRPAFSLDGVEINDYLGNSDGIVNPGEFIYAGIGLENYGTATSFSVNLTAVPDDPYLNPYSNAYLYNIYLYYPQIDPGEVEYSYNLIFGIASDTPENYNLIIPLIIRDSTEFIYTEFLVLSVTGSDTTPPYVSNAEVDDYYVPQGEPCLITAYVYETGLVASVSASIEAPDETPIAEVPLYDDATHGDLVAGDRVYSNSWTPTLQADFYVDIAAEDELGNSSVADNMTYFTSRPFTPSEDILLVLDGDEEFEFFSYYTDALDENSYTYDVWDTRFRGTLDLTLLDLYQDGVVIWAMPTFGSLVMLENQEGLINYLDNGGRLFITGQQLGMFLTSSYIPFYQDYLHATYVQDATVLYTLNGVAGDPISDGMVLSISGGDGADNQEFADEIDPIEPAVPIFFYTEEMRSLDGIIGSGSGALRVDTGIYRLVYFAFGFEAINDLGGTSRAEVMDNVLSWLLAP